MALARPRRLAPGVERLLGDDPLVEVAGAGDVTILRPERPGRDVAVLHQAPPDTDPLVAAVDRLWWLDGRGPAPQLLAVGRSAEGDESAVIRLPATAASVGSGLVPLGPEEVVSRLAAALADLHAQPIEDAPFDASIARLRAEAGRRVGDGVAVVVDDGPYAGRDPAALLAVLDDMIAALGDVDPRIVHGTPVVEHAWIDHRGDVVLTGWTRTGVGDPHHDLAVAAASLRDHFGPTVVAPFLDAYGLDAIDLRRLDAHQLLAHLLT